MVKKSFVVVHRKKQQQTKRLNEHQLIWRFVLRYVCMCVCVCHILYVSWCSWSMSTHGYICEHRECNVIVSFCVLCLLLCLVTLNLFHLAAHCFISILLPLFPTYCLLSLSRPVPSLLLLICPPRLLLCFPLSGSAFPSSPRPPPSLSPPCRVPVQETSGLSPAVGCGWHGEDARAGLEVRLYVPAGVLQRSGDEGPG